MTVRFVAAVVAALAAGGGCVSAPERRDQSASEEEECIGHLRAIYEAIQAYRKGHQDLPGFLSDLVPAYLPNADSLVCPVHRRTGVDQLYQLDDPHIYTSYTYEFSARPVPTNIWGGSRMTMKAWRQRTMGVLGGGTPIVRCHLHKHVINMSFDGEVYFSDTNWDRLPRFDEKASRSDYRPDP